MKIRINPLDKLFSQYIRGKADGICEWCGEHKNLQTSHFKGRTRQTVRWDEENVSAICFTCHRYMHDHPDIHTDWFEKRLGREKYDKMIMRANMTTKEYPIDKEQIKKNLLEKIKMLQEV